MRMSIWVSKESHYTLVKISKKLNVNHSELIRRALSSFYQNGDHELTEGDKKLILRDQKERCDLILKYDMGKVFFYRNALKTISKAIAFSHDKDHIYGMIDSYVVIAKEIYDDKKAVSKLKKMKSELRKCRDFDAIKQEVSEWVISNEHKNTNRKVRTYPEVDMQQE